MTTEQITQMHAVQEHKEPCDYICGLSMKILIEPLNIIFYQDEINKPGKLKEYDNFRNIYNNILFKALNNREYEDDDNIIINNIKLVIEGIHNNTISYDDFNYDFSIKTEKQRNIGLTRNDVLGLFLTRYNIIPLNKVFLDSIEEDIKTNPIIKVIETKIKFKHVIENIKDYYSKHISKYKDNKYIIGELAKKFNLNFRIHSMNDKTNKE